MAEESGCPICPETEIPHMHTPREICASGCLKLPETGWMTPEQMAAANGPSPEDVLLDRLEAIEPRLQALEVVAEAARLVDRLYPATHTPAEGEPPCAKCSLRLALKALDALSGPEKAQQEPEAKDPALLVNVLEDSDGPG